MTNLYTRFEELEAFSRKRQQHEDLKYCRFKELKRLRVNLDGSRSLSMRGFPNIGALDEGRLLN